MGLNPTGQLKSLRERIENSDEISEEDREAIDVPAFDPRRGAGTAHLWYVVEDLDLLHQLLSLDIERWAPPENILSTGGSQIVVDDPERLEPVECNGTVLQEFVRSWRKGRGERVDRDALEDSGAVSENFIDRVTNLAEELTGDGERIIEALRDGQVDQFRRNKMDELEAYFEENGYIESIDPLDPEQVRVRVIDRLVERDVPREEVRERGLRLLDRLAVSVDDS